MNDIINLITRPKYLFGLIAGPEQTSSESQIPDDGAAVEKFKWGMLFVILLLLYLIKDIISFPIGQQIMDHNEAFSKLPPDQVETIKTMGQKLKYVGLIGNLFMYAVKALLLSLGITLGVFIFRGRINFEKALSLAIVLGFTLAFGELVNAGILLLNGVEKIQSQYDVFKIGLNVFASPDGVGHASYIILAFLNPFQAWYLILMVMGIHRISGLKISSSVIISAIIWIISISIAVGLLMLAESRMPV